MDPALPRPSHRAVAGRDAQHTPRSFAKIQADTVSLQVREILPLLLKAKTADADAQQVLQQLGRWTQTWQSKVRSR